MVFFYCWKFDFCSVGFQKLWRWHMGNVVNPNRNLARKLKLVRLSAPPDFQQCDEQSSSFLNQSRDVYKCDDRVCPFFSIFFFSP
ncbi:hypothetical protein BC937DRAFT_88697, partial [Endogone sp. FLAS-F59071]